VIGAWERLNNYDRGTFEMMTPHVYVTLIHPNGGDDSIEKILKVHKTHDLRRIVRKYKKDFDCDESEGTYHYILKPRNGAIWRILIGHN
jgi:hypothetical protein